MPRTSAAPPALLLLSEPICAVGHGVAALCCATNEDRSWVFQGYSVTGVSTSWGSHAVVGPESTGTSGTPWGPTVTTGNGDSSPGGTRLAVSAVPSLPSLLMSWEGPFSCG